MKTPAFKYDKVRHSLNTFDILIFKYGTQWWNPKHWFWTAIGHVAEVYRCEETGQLMCWESNITQYDGLSGVQLRPLREVIAKYPGRVIIRRVSMPSIIRACSEKQMPTVIRELRGKDYPDISKPTGRWKLITSAVDFGFWGKDHFIYNGEDTGIFCSMLLMLSYIKCNLSISTAKPFRTAAEYEPDDFREGRDKKLIKLLAPFVTVGPEFEVVL